MAAAEKKSCMSKPPLIAIFFERSRTSKNASASPRHKVTTPMSWPTTRSRRLSQQTYFICAAAASSTAANLLGRARGVRRAGICARTLKQLYIEAEYLPKAIHVPIDFEDRELLEETLTDRAAHKVEIHTPQRGQKARISGSCRKTTRNIRSSNAFAC